MRKLKKWGSEPIFLPRWLLTIKYSLLTLLGLAVAVATAPSLDEVVSSESYSSAWGVGLALAGCLATVGSTAKEREDAEKVGGTVLVALLAVYAASPVLLVLQGDMDRLAYSVVAVTLLMLPTARLVQLIRGSAHG